jgi:indolepyruvate ferredoxin oxidoreductase beta subunit
MASIIPPDRDRITIAILALGGEGGGVLADWILQIANQSGYVAQGTSVPGVAQRTGSTIYYIEMIRSPAAGANHPAPVLALMPVPGDVDIVIASELMEAGRAILRGFVSKDRTTLIGSTHRVYAISEKSALGDGIAASQRVLDAAGRRAARFIGFDMAAAASVSGSMISSVMFGALAGSDVLPFPREAFEEAIRHGGKAIESNLKGFGLGLSSARTKVTEIESEAAPPEPTTEAGRMLKNRITATLPASAWPMALEGARRLMDYQDRAYADLYLDRLAAIRGYDAGDDDSRLTRETARHLALWMAYEDTIRVADLKIRATRSARVEREVGLTANQIITVTEYMHPRLQEVCETLPARLGRSILGSATLRRGLEPLFAKGRHVETTGLRWFLALRVLASLRHIRRSTLRYADEQQRIADWLAFVTDAARSDNALAVELVAAQSLLKGYGDTYERGCRNFFTVMAAARPLLGREDGAARVRALVSAGLADDRGAALADLVTNSVAA